MPKDIDTALSSSQRNDFNNFPGMNTRSGAELGSVLVIGGSGFVGFHMTQYFLRQPICTSIYLF